MPPVAASDVDVPAEWRDKVNILLQIWQKKQRQHGRNSSILGAISLFDGRPRDWRLSACLQQAGVPCVSIDVRNSLDQDILSETGRDYFLGCLMKLAPNSLLWMAPECSTWIWLNRVHNQRSLDRPQGELTSSSVHQANQTAAFVARALKLATSRGQVLGVRLVPRPLLGFRSEISCKRKPERSFACHSASYTSAGIYVVIEQPSSSLLWKIPDVVAALEICAARKCSVSFCDFGSESSKPLTLMGTVPWLQDLTQEGRQLRKDSSSTSTSGARKTLAWTDDRGGKHGQPDLRSSEEYPKCFCAAWLHRQSVSECLNRLCGMCSTLANLIDSGCCCKSSPGTVDKERPL